MSRRVEPWWGVLAVVVAGLACAAEEAPPPSLELLEFLGEWTQDDASFVDPTAVADTSTPAPAPRQETGDE